jgi:hypothetical protein
MVQGRWVQKWHIESSSEAGKKYVVSLSSELVWGCSCPVWKFRRQECHHIKQVKFSLQAKDGDVGSDMKLVAILIDKLKREGKTDDEIVVELSKDRPILEPIYQEGGNYGNRYHR